MSDKIISKEETISSAIVSQIISVMQLYTNPRTDFNNV